MKKNKYYDVRDDMHVLSIDELENLIDKGGLIACRFEIENFETQAERNAYYKAVQATLCDVGYPTTVAHSAEDALRSYIES